MGGFLFTIFIAMPELSRFFSIIVKMLYDDTKQHNNRTFEVIMNKIVSIYNIGDYKLKLEFINGEIKVYDFSSQLDFPAFRPLCLY